MAVQGSLGPLLRGVSQQPARVRLDGQVSEQVNLVSAVDTGLSTRTGTDQIGLLTSATSSMSFYEIELDDTHYIFGYESGVFKAWDLDGTEYTVNFQDTSAQNYVGDEMRFHVYDDVVYCVNRDAVVAKDTTSLGYSHHIVGISCLGGNYSRTYTVTVTHSGGTISGTYTTPDGDSSGDSTKTSSEYIILKIKEYIDANETVPTGMSVSVADDVLIFMYDESMTVTVEDGEAGTVLRAISDDADSTTDLPRFAPHGSIVRIVGDTAEEDDYWLRFNASTTDTDGSGFGDEGVWEEWYDPTQANAYDLSTMPHTLTLSGGAFTFSRGSWEARQTGDDDSNPMPSFVGKKIRDIGGFESRLVVATSQGTVVMSRTNYPLDFFKKSATTLVGSDPIDIKSTREGSLSLDWIVPFDRDLLIISDPGDAQYVITSGGITPDNASMPLTTSYEMFGYTRPVTTGRTLVFPFLAGGYAGIKEFFTNDQVATNGADTLTEVQQQYIEGAVDDMSSSKNFNTLLFHTSDPNSKNTVWVYKYLWEGVERVQSAWGKWVFVDAVRKMFFVNSKVYFIIEDSHGHWLLRGDMNKPFDANQSYQISLDRKSSLTVSNSQVTTYFEDPRFVQDTGCLNIGREIRPVGDPVVNADGTYTYTFDSELAPDSAIVVAGQQIDGYVEPTMPHIKDRDGKPISTARVVVTKFRVHLSDSGDVYVDMYSPYRPTYRHEDRRFPLDDEPLDPEQTLISDSIVEVPWGDRAEWSSLRVGSTNVRPMTITEIEYEAQVTGTKRRV